MNSFDSPRFFKRLGISLFVLLAIAVPLGLVGPTRPDTTGYEDAREEALDDADANELLAEGAPQQAVVNGWLARDLAVIQIAQQNDQLILLHLIAAILVAVALAVVIAGVGALNRPPTPHTVPAPVDPTAA